MLGVICYYCLFNKSLFDRLFDFALFQVTLCDVEMLRKLLREKACLEGVVAELIETNATLITITSKSLL